MTSKPDREQDSHPEEERFLHPLGADRDRCSLPELVFDAKLQEFARQVSYICAVESKGKISPQIAYSQIRMLVHQLKESNKESIESPSDSSQA